MITKHISLSLISVLISVACVTLTSASDAAKFSTDGATQYVAAQQESTLCTVSIAGNPQPKHFYDLKKLTEQLKRLPTVLTLKIIQLSEVSKTVDIFSCPDDFFKDCMSRESVIGTEDYVFEDNIKKVLLSMKGKQANDANLLHILAESCKVIHRFHEYFLSFDDNKKKSTVDRMRSDLDCIIEPTLQVSALNRAVMKSLLQLNTSTSATNGMQLALRAQQALPAALRQLKAKRTREEQEVVIRRSARIAAQQKKKK